MAHEQSETVQDPNTGEWYNVYGKALPKAGQQLPNSQRYKTMEEAVEAAKKRSESYHGGDTMPNMYNQLAQMIQGAPTAAGSYPPQGFPVARPAAPAPQGRYYDEMPADAERAMLLTQMQGEGGMANMMGGAFAPDNRFVGQQQGAFLPTIARWRANRRADERLYGKPQHDPLAQQAPQEAQDPGFLDRLMQLLNTLNPPPVSPMEKTEPMSVRG